ncbi:ThuA domain-containing protein [Synoicihabitans lomoniglobus]|uniref:ThuA domain-containing protein n=1 Tax=Synoicihabitans lomoniglobus TaxID=2909285 RepID=A0AAF0CRF6_9BACT|nr:ThuA domain-containing protein [Opitutaceae bacterium LMO-M01]WED66722.1 ThuA domain-containing protein [Opitutaceae bacterium LMO-M01]
MKPRLPLLLIALTLAVFGAASLSAETLKVLYFTKSSGYEHSVVRRGSMGEPSHSENVLKSLAAQHDIAFTFSKDGSLFSEDYLNQFDVVFFYTSGNLEMVGSDGNPPMSAAGKLALLSWVANGGGFMATHAGGDSFHTYEKFNGNTPKDKRGYRYQLNGEASDPYIKMLGGEFINHGPQQVATALVTDTEFPGMGPAGEAIHVMEEWYSLKEFSPINHVVLVMQTAGMEGSDYQRPDYPLSWAKPYGEGRVWYSGMGHREDVWEAEYFQSILVGAMEWTGGRTDANITPNLLEAAPGALTLPPAR